MAVQRGQDPERQSERYGYRGSGNGKEQRVAEAQADQLGYLALVGKGAAHIALEHAPEPVEIPDMCGDIEAEFSAERGNGLGCGALAENFFRDIAWKKLDSEKNNERNNKKRKEAQRKALGNHFQDLCHAGDLLQAKDHRSANLQPSISQLPAICSDGTILSDAANT